MTAIEIDRAILQLEAALEAVANAIRNYNEGGLCGSAQGLEAMLYSLSGKCQAVAKILDGAVAAEQAAERL